MRVSSRAMCASLLVSALSTTSIVNGSRNDQEVIGIETSSMQAEGPTVAGLVVIVTGVIRHHALGDRTPQQFVGQPCDVVIATGISDQAVAIPGTSRVEPAPGLCYESSPEEALQYRSALRERSLWPSQRDRLCSVARSGAVVPRRPSRPRPQL